MNYIEAVLKGAYNLADYVPAIGIVTITTKALNQASGDVGEAFRIIPRDYRGRATLQIAYLGLHIAIA